MNFAGTLITVTVDGYLFAAELGDDGQKVEIRKNGKVVGSGVFRYEKGGSVLEIDSVIVSKEYDWQLRYELEQRLVQRCDLAYGFAESRRQIQWDNTVRDFDAWAAGVRKRYSSTWGVHFTKGWINAGREKYNASKQ